MPIRAWLARLLEPPTTPPYSDQAGDPPRKQPRGCRASLSLECLEERSLLSAGTGLTGQYFADVHFGQLKVTRTDATVNFNWGADRSPAPGVPGDHFSVRWSGWVQPLYSQTYTFSTRTDEGVRLSVGGQTIINDWAAHPLKEDRGTIRLVAGQKYWVQMDYFQGTGAAQAQLLWSSPSQVKQVIPASRLFPRPAAPAANAAPKAQLSAGNVSTAGGSSYLFTVTYQDGNGVNAASLCTGNVRVTGPNGFSQLATLVKVDRAGNGTPRTATYRVTPPGGSWDAHDNGTYTVSLLASQVKDVKGTFAPAGTLGTFRVAAPAANAGPKAQLSAGNVSTAGGSSYLFTVTYQDGDGVNAASLRTGNVRVTGPNGFSQLATLVKVDRAGNGTPRTATYRITPPGGSWDVRDNGTYTVSLLASQVRDVKGAFAPAGTLGTFRVAVPAPDWFSTSLHDPGVRNLARTLDADHTLSRTDMMAVFREVEGGGVTATELGDLHTLANNASRLGMPDYVRDLSGKVIGNDPANLHYRGKNLGYLHAGSTGSQLEMLVEKWFLGTDHPVAASNTHYAYAQGSLFGSGPVYTDIQQGWIGDCYFLGGLAETVFRNPTAIRNMFIDNGDGTFTVRFLHDGTPTYVTVDRYLPVDSQGQLPYAHTQKQASSPSDKLWVALAEKAYAQLAESGWSRPSEARNAYDALSVGWEGDAVAQITGQAATYLRITGTGSLSSIVSAFRAGKLLGLDSRPATASSIVPDHTYAMVGYNASTGMFTLYNPWGKVQAVSGKTVVANFDHWNQAIS